MDTVTSLSLDFIRAEDAGDRYAFRLGAQEYVLRGAGGGVENLELQWNQALLADLAALHEPGCDPALIQRVGGTLRAFLKADEWARQEVRLLEAVAREQPVVVTIRSAAAELYALPWELLSVGASGQHLGELPSVLVRYEWPETVTAAEAPSPRPEGGRVLLAWSAAGGLVPVSEHLRAIQEGAREGHHSFDPKRDVIERATYGRLDDVLKAAKAPGGAPISVLHLLCHGGAAGKTCGLVLDGEYPGEPTVVDAGRLRQLLTPYAGMVRLVVIAACNSGNIGALGNQLGSIAQALHQVGIAAVIASRFPLSIPGSNRFSEVFYRKLLGGPSSVETAFLAARRQLARDTSRLDWASMQLYARDADGRDSRPVVLRPYRGLLAFQPEHSRFFFGREAEITETLNDLGALAKTGAPRFLVIAGASGTGKSSVVLAGAVPRLLQAPGATWVFARMRPGSAPLAGLESALAARTEQGRPLLLVVDQFEEVFTQTESAEERNTFARRLWALAADPGSGVSVLVTLRVDFIGRCGELVLDDQGLRLDKVAYDEAHRVFVAQMAEAQLEEAITRPAQLVGLTLEAGLARRMIKDVDGEPGALPLLQDTLDMLWQQRQGRMLAQAAYDAAGGVSGALSLRADARINELDEAGRSIARRLLLRLVNVQSDTAMDTRRRATLAELRPGDSQEASRFDRILGRLVDERLLVRTGDGQETTVEVAHEALIRNWQQLRGWVNDDRARLLARQEIATKVTEWKKHGALLNERQLSLAEAVLRDSAEELGGDARKLIEESRAAALKRQRIQRAALVVTAAVAVGFAVLGAWALKQADTARKQTEEATKQKGEAKLQAQQARDANRVAVARQLAGHAESAMAVLREVEAQDPGQVLGWLAAVPHFDSLVFLRGVVLKEHTKQLSYAGFSPDGTLIVTASWDGTARVWKRSGEQVAVLKGHLTTVSSAAFSPEGTRVVTASEDGTARIYKSSGELIAVLEGHGDAVSSATFSPDGARVVTASRDGTARIWKTDGASIAVLGHGKGVMSARFSADGTRVVTASLDKTARVWKVNGTQLAVMKHEDGVNFAEFSRDGTQIVTASFDRTARVWRADGAPLAVLGHQNQVYSAKFSPDGTRVVTHSHEDIARVWRADGTPMAILKGHRGSLFSAVFSEDGRSVLTASSDGTARVWTADGTPLTVLDGHEGWVKWAEFSADGRYIVTASQDGTARIWKDDQAIAPILQGHAGKVLSAEFSPDGARVVTASSDKTGRIWEVDKGSLAAVLRGHTAALNFAAFSHDGARVVTASEDRTVRIWKADDGAAGPVRSDGLYVDRVAFSPGDKDVVTQGRVLSEVWHVDGPALAKSKAKDELLMAVGPEGLRLVLYEKTAKVWKADGTLLAELPMGKKELKFAAFSPKGERLVLFIAAGDAEVRTIQGGLVTKLEGYQDYNTKLAFSPDGQRLAMVSGRKSVKVWSVEDGRLLMELQGHEDFVTSVQFSPDGDRLVTASSDRSVRVWNTESKDLIALIRGHGAEVNSASFSFDGKRLVTASNDGTAKVWTVDPELLRRQFWFVTSLCLRPADRSFILGESDAHANQGYTACELMSRCLRDDKGLVVPDKYEGCREEFRNAQAQRYSIK